MISIRRIIKISLKMRRVSMLLVACFYGVIASATKGINPSLVIIGIRTLIGILVHISIITMFRFTRNHNIDRR